MGIFEHVVVFGAPGTGKTLLLAALRDLNGDATCRYYFVTIDEPTQDPEIARMLAAVYQESPTAIGAGTSQALLVQTRIADARAQLCSKFMTGELLRAQHEAQRQHKTLVVVSDGHLLTDEKIYVRRRGDLKQITDAEMPSFLAYRQALLRTLPEPMANPSLFCQMMIGNDSDGMKHQHRVCTLRNNETERGVPACEFAEFARYADDAYNYFASVDQSSAANTHRACRLDTDNKEPSAVVAEFVQLLGQQTQ